MSLELPPDADPQTQKLFRAFVENGRLTTMPARQSRRLPLFDLIAQLFEPGVKYDEYAVNRVLMGVHDDYVALRRYLIEAGFLERDGAIYWRSGGTVEP